MADIATLPQRKARADGQRNRALILEAAKRVLTDKGAGASMDEIAQAAGVGNGTFYRHFPTRATLVAEVCREDTRDLIGAARTLAFTHAPLDALGAWLETFIDYIATKQIIAEAASALVSLSSDLSGPSGADVKAALRMLVERAVAEGCIKADVEPLDLMRAIAGVATIGPQTEWEHNARRLVPILVAGLSARVM